MNEFKTIKITEKTLKELKKIKDETGVTLYRIVDKAIQTYKKEEAKRD